MILASLLGVILALAAWAQPSLAGGFDAHMAAQVYGAALAFMEPRTLEPVPIPQLTVWGLGGLTALDPALRAEARDGAIRLISPAKVFVFTPLPQGGDALAWGQVAANVAETAREVSAPVRNAGTEDLIRSFFDELFNHLDPYSRYVGPEEAVEDIEARSGRAGLGVVLTENRGAILVQQVLPDGPAAQAGIRPGSRILAIDGGPVQGKDPAAVAALLSGPVGTPVLITLRGENGRVRRMQLIRALVPPETVFAQWVRRMLVLRITGFNQRTDERLAREITAGLSGRHRPDGLVLDLRGNPGGLLNQAVDVSRLLLPSGVVALTAGRDPATNRVFRSPGPDIAPNLPVVVVVDGRTSSAAEIVAASLSDRGRAVVVGSSTLGKGLIQTVSRLPNGGELFVTWARILAPLGWPIQGLGVLPQVCTSLGGRVLQAELAELSAGRAPMARALARHDRARAP
ncbi:MAG: S41 family peptidase, partial [Acetobacteraceae bacterium]|nr:S41 family peptidase [Acetobacteraceae bacterium]